MIGKPIDFKEILEAVGVSHDGTHNSKITVAKGPWNNRVFFPSGQTPFDSDTFKVVVYGWKGPRTISGDACLIGNDENGEYLFMVGCPNLMDGFLRELVKRYPSLVVPVSHPARNLLHVYSGTGQGEW